MTVRSDLRWRDDDDGVKKKCDVTTTCGDVRVLQSNHLVFLLFMYNYVRVLRFYFTKLVCTGTSSEGRRRWACNYLF